MYKLIKKWTDMSEHYQILEKCVRALDILLVKFTCKSSSKLEHDFLPVQNLYHLICTSKEDVLYREKQVQNMYKISSNSVQNGSTITFGSRKGCFCLGKNSFDNLFKEVLRR